MMSATWLGVIGVAVAFLLVFVTGFWLTHSGRPYGVAILAVHKVVAVGILVYLGTSAYRANKMSALGSSVWLVVSLAVLAFVAMIASGGVLSAVESAPVAVEVLHKAASYATVLLTVVAFYYLRWRSA